MCEELVVRPVPSAVGCEMLRRSSKDWWSLSLIEERVAMMFVSFEVSDTVGAMP